MVNSVGGNDGVDAVDTGKMTNFNENIAFPKTFSFNNKCFRNTLALCF